MDIRYHWYSETNLRAIIWTVFCLAMGLGILWLLAIGSSWGVRFDTPTFLYPIIGGITAALTLNSLRPVLKKLRRR